MSHGVRQTVCCQASVTTQCGLKIAIKIRRLGMNVNSIKQYANELKKARRAPTFEEEAKKLHVAIGDLQEAVTAYLSLVRCVFCNQWSQTEICDVCSEEADEAWHDRPL